MYIADVYRKGVGVIQPLGPFSTEEEVLAAMDEWCKNHNVHVVAREKCGLARWNYLSDGTEFDYCLED